MGVGFGVCVAVGVGEGVKVGEMLIVNWELGIGSGVALAVGMGVGGVGDGTVWQLLSREIATKQSQYLANTHCIIDMNHTQKFGTASNVAATGDSSSGGFYPVIAAFKCRKCSPSSFFITRTTSGTINFINPLPDASHTRLMRVPPFSGLKV